MDRVVITKPFMTTGGLMGLCHMQVCCTKNATDNEILQVCNKENPSGTTNGWTKVCRAGRKDYEGIVKCDNDANRVHILVSC